LSPGIRITTLDHTVPEIYVPRAIIVLGHDCVTGAVSGIAEHEAMGLGGGGMGWFCDGECLVSFC
jgi:hypothetical protein